MSSPLLYEISETATFPRGHMTWELYENIRRGKKGNPSKIVCFWFVIQQPFPVRSGYRAAQALA